MDVKALRSFLAARVTEELAEFGPCDDETVPAMTRLRHEGLRKLSNSLHAKYEPTVTQVNEWLLLALPYHSHPDFDREWIDKRLAR